MALRSLLPVFLAGVAAWGMSAVSAGAATYTTLYAMPGTGDGAGPQGGFVEAGSTLYGTTTYGGASGNGTIIKLDPATGTVTKLHDFAGGSDGFFPPANLLKLGGLLYGVTQYGGAQGLGTLFTYDPATRREAVVWSFGGPEGVVPTCTLIAVGGNLYGTTQYGGAHGDGTVFRLVPSTGTVSAVYSFSGGNDAANPIVGLALSGSSLYGTSPNGGANGAGVIFAVDPETGSESVVYNFGNGTDAAYPYAPLTAAKGVLYGTTTGGGTAGLGTVFSFNPASRVETILHGFSGATDGAGPVAGLSISNGVLYGATAYDGPSNGGTLFSLAVSGTGFAVLHAFGVADGQYPAASPLLLNDTLYGTTAFGGALVTGAVYSLSLQSGTEEILHSFAGSLAEDNVLGVTVLNGTVYALSGFGGATGAGAVAAISPSSGKARLLHDFSSSGGFGPDGNLTADGALYGVSAFGGNAGCGGLGCGTVFKLSPSTGEQTQVFAFPASAGGLCSVGNLLNVSGVLYGTTCDNGNYGSIFKIDPKTGAKTTLYSFTGGADGSGSYAQLLYVKGSLYGTTGSGGQYGLGTIFKLSLTTLAKTVLYSFSGGVQTPGNGDAATPFSGLIDVGGTLYGTTFWGGAFGWGTVYAFDLTKGAEKVLHSFEPNGIDGTQPVSDLLYLNGLLYGLTEYGGSKGAGCAYNACGIVYSVDPASGEQTILHSFTGGADGGNPSFGAPLVSYGGVLYGATSSAGAHGLGTVFSLQP